MPPPKRRKNPRDIFIPAKYLNGAMHKDRVVVKIVKRGENESATGEVEKFLERGYTEIVGAFYKDRRAGQTSAGRTQIFFLKFIFPSPRAET